MEQSEAINTPKNKKQPENVHSRKEMKIQEENFIVQFSLRSIPFGMQLLDN